MSQIKQLQPKEGTTLLAWLAPPEFKEFAGLVGDHLYYWGKLHTRTDYPYSVKLPYSSLEFIGVADQIDEEQAKELMSEDFFLPGFVSDQERLQYFFEANKVHSVNPMGDEPDIENYLSGRQHAHFLRLWKKDQANTGTWVILKIINT